MSASVVLLCEDLQLATFIRRFLKRRGWHARQIRELIAPPGEVAGEQWVRERFPDELTAIRARHAKTVLIVGTDADHLSVEARIATLNEECKRRGIAPRSKEEPVIMVVPKRNVESWFAYLRGEVTNEKDIYSRYDRESECEEDVRKLDEMCKTKQLRDPPPSLLSACKEFKRMPKRY